MQQSRPITPPFRTATSVALLGSCVLLLGGCSTPSAANIALRKQLQDQQAQIDRLTVEHAADVATTRGAASRPVGAPNLSPVQLATLYTVHGVRLGRLTTVEPPGVDANAKAATVVVHVVPTDDDGNDFKAAGSIEVKAFDLARDGRQVAGCDVDTAAARALWNGNALRYEYVVRCPLDTPVPAGTELTVRVTFTDALTGRVFDAQTVAKVPSE